MSTIAPIVKVMVLSGPNAMVEPSPPGDRLNASHVPMIDAGPAVPVCAAAKHGTNITEKMKRIRRRDCIACTTLTEF
jgi:hypothetical protein